MKRSAVAIVIVLLASVLVQPMASSQDAGEELILRVAMQDDMKTTNPLVAGDVWTWNVLDWIYESAILEDFETGELIPYIAVGTANVSQDLSIVDWNDCTVGNFGYNSMDSWENASKPEAIVFYDFENVYWHDGTQMSIRDVMFSFHVAAQHPHWRGDVECLAGNGSYVYGNYSEDNWLHIETAWESPDDLKAALKFTLQRPFGDFFDQTLSIFLLPYHLWGSSSFSQNVNDAKIWLDTDYDVDSEESWKFDIACSYENNPPVGNGMFEWGHWDHGSIIKITTWRGHFYREGYKYEDYAVDDWVSPLADQPNIDAMVFKIYKTAEQAVMALKNYEIDYIAWSVPPTFVQELVNEPGIALQQSPKPGFSYLAYNMRRQSFGYNETGQDVGKPVRKAVAHCIDKNKAVQRLLLNFGIAGNGPVSSLSPWYNESVPKYAFDPEHAKNILENAGYIISDPSMPPGNGNWWLNPDGSDIGNGSDGKIEILCPGANYDPTAYRTGLCVMIAQQLRDIGINAQAKAMDFGSIVDKIEKRDFDMYILRWEIGSDPDDYLHAFFHSSNAGHGQNYPGYQNESFDELIDLARMTSDHDVKKKAIYDAQASISYDLPYDVLYYEKNIEAYRSYRFTGWIAEYGTIFNRQSIMNIDVPGPRLFANFISPPSAMGDNETAPISILVRDEDQEPISGAYVKLNVSSGTLEDYEGVTNEIGKFTTTFTSPYVPPTPDNINNGTSVIVKIVEATYNYGDFQYDPAPPKMTVITVYPEEVPFLTVKMSADPDVIDPDVNEDGSYGFTYVDVIVEDQNGDPAPGINVAVEISPAVPTITPEEETTDADGKATFKVTAIDLPDNDGSVYEYTVTTRALHPADSSVKKGEQSLVIYIVDAELVPDGLTSRDYHIPELVLVVSAFLIAAVAIGLYRRRLKR